MSPVQPVEQWHAALNSGDVETLVALVDPHVTIGGPRGTTSGADVVREWVERANARFIPLQWFARENIVVVEQRAEWIDDAGAVSSAVQVATVFFVSEARIVAIHRHDSLGEALEAAGLSASDQVAAP